MKNDRDELVQTVAQEVYSRWEERHPAPPPAPTVPSPPPAGEREGLAALGAGVARRVVDPRKIALDVLRPCIKSLIQSCHSGAYDISRVAIGALGRIRDWSSVDALLELLENQELNSEVAKALAKIGDYRAVDPLIRVIDSGRWSNPEAIILALGGFRTRAATVELVKFLQDPSPQIRAYACQALKDFTYDQEVEFALLAATEDPDEAVVLAALQSLKSLDSEPTTERLIELYRTHRNEKIQATVFPALEGCSKQVASILAITEDALSAPNDRVRANAVEVLWSLDVDPSALRTLLSKAAQDPHNRVRANVAIGYGKIDPRESVSILSEMFSDPDRRVRASAVYAARFIENDRVALWLLSTLTLEKSQELLESALEGLSMVGGEGVVEALLGMVPNPNPLIRRGVAEALANKTDKRIAPALVSRYAVEDDPTVCAAIMATIGKIGGGEYVNFLTEGLRSSSFEVQAAAIESLTDLSRLEIIGVLEPFVRSPSPILQARSCLALWNLGQLDVADKIQGMLADLRSPATVMEAIDVLGRIGDGLSNLKDPRLVHLSAALKNYEEAAVVEVPVAPVPSRPPTSPGLARIPDSFVQIEEMDAIMNLMAMGETQMAMELAHKCCEDRRDDPLATYILGKIQMRGPNPKEAAGSFDKSQSLSRTFFPSSLNLARISQTSGDLGGAFGAFLEAFRRKLKMIEQQIDITKQLLDEKRNEEVSAMIKELLAQVPLEGGVYLKLGVRFLKAKRFSEAFDNLRRAYAFDGENNAVRFNLALACYHMGKAKECKLLCNRVLKAAAPDSPEAQRALHLMELL
jgi:HEAT repeat protein/tetratricopeptide (TPR) repeat protein